MSRPDNISDSLAAAEWELIAHTLATLNCGIEPRTPATRRLRAQLGVIRVIMYEKIRGWNGNSSIDLSFFIASFKTVQMMEREFDAMGIKKRDFLIFLKLLLNKLEKQKLVVKKPHQTLSEFRKMKGVVENGDNLI